MYVLLNGKLVNTSVILEFERIDSGNKWLIVATQSGPGNNIEYEFATEGLRNKRWTELDLELR